MVEYKPATTALSVDVELMDPRVKELFLYWRSLADPPSLPHWGGASGKGFNLLNVAPDILSILTIVDTGPNPEDYIYRYWGSGRFLFLGNRPDPTGRPILEGLAGANAANVLQQYRQVYQSGEPVLMQNTWTLDNGLVAECQTLRLPLAADDGDGVGKIVAVTKFLQHADEIRRLEE